MLAILQLIAIATAAYIPSDNYSTLTPSAAPTGTTDYTASFGIQVETIASAAASGVAKREVSQIGDGQIQAATTTDAPAATGVVQQIGDGQIQQQSSVTAVNPTTTSSQPQPSVIGQIGDGQIQNQGINQIGDGQIQNGASQISDGQIQNTDSSGNLQTCATSNSLSMTLKDSILTDSKGRIGAIVANRQFQFDGPPPQAGSIYAAGWSIVDGYLALGDSDEFYQCLSGDFYNLYDQDVADQCHAVKLAIVDLVSC